MANASPPASTLAAFNAATPQAAERDVLACRAPGSFAKLIADVEVDMSPFGLGNGGEVFYAAGRPYGPIEGTVTRDDAPPPGKAW